jgi:2,2-dialkylglycine decarboxylase (pyruvate)
MKLLRTHEVDPLIIVRSEGCRVWDSEGNGYLDLSAGTWCSVLGHNHPAIREAVCDQVGRLTHLGSACGCEEVERGLAKLGEILPPELSRAVFLNTGSEAVELALKLAHAVHRSVDARGKSGNSGGEGIVVSIGRGYYGATIYALSLSEIGRTAGYLPRMGSCHRLPAPDCRRCPAGRVWPCGDFACLDPLRALVSQTASIAAVIYEPVIGPGGVLVPPPGYGRHLRDLASQSGALLIAEEVTTGMGRTGRWFAYEHDGIVPDLLVIGKALGAGFPVAAVATTEAVDARCHGVVRHVQSHQNDPLSGRLAATVIGVLQDEKLVEAAAEKGRALLVGLQDLQRRHAHIADVRGKGLMLGVEVESTRAEAAAGVRLEMRRLGYLVDYHAPSCTFRLFPPYVISGGEIAGFLEAFGRALRSVM